MTATLRLSVEDNEARPAAPAVSPADADLPSTAYEPQVQKKSCMFHYSDPPPRGGA